MDFLDKVAHRLYENHSAEMDGQVVVLPSRRAGLYLTRFLSRLSDRPMWAPKMVTVSELFSSLSDLVPVSNETLIFELYRIYRRGQNDKMTFDDFWSWGEVIVSDFNDIDLYLADAARLYSNISDLKEIDERFGGLSEEQIQIIRSFWTSFSPGASGSKARTTFFSVWKMLSSLYQEFTAKLKDKGIAGEGMICRDVAVKAQAGMLPLPEGKTWHITGLNALNECEKKLFRYLKAAGRAYFYWDDEHRFMEDDEHRASAFIRENLALFGNDLGNAGKAFSSGQKGKWKIIDVPSDTAQAKMLPRLLGESGLTSGSSDLTDTAIILADEKLLMPVLTSLPGEVTDINVTMGHPFRFTPLYSFLKQLFVVARSARRTDGKLMLRTESVITLLRHQYFRIIGGAEGDNVISDLISGNMVKVGSGYLDERLSVSQLFRFPESGSEMPGYLTGILEMLEQKSFEASTPQLQMSVDREYIRIARAETVKLGNLIREYGLELKIDTSVRLLDRIFRKLIVPFSGEPLRGIQVMGVLETRALEFSNIIFLSLNEGIFPNTGFDNTYIPYNIRRAFGLPTLSDHEAVYSYHFFRLLRKPIHGWFLFNSTTRGLNTGEMSRYLTQMTYDASYEHELLSLIMTIGRNRNIPEALRKSDEHLRILSNRYLANEVDTVCLSPSALTTWMTCRMKFYYRYVCGMPEEEKLEKEIDQRKFGNILHETMKRLYEPYTGRGASAVQMAGLSSVPDMVKKTLLKAAAEEMKWSEKDLLAGKGTIIIGILERYICEILKYDEDIDHLALLHLEDDFSREYKVKSGAGTNTVRIGGRIDRVDRIADALRVVDYKTGTPKRDRMSVEDLFDEEKERRNDALLQTMIYCDVLSSSFPGEEIIPSIYWVQQISAEDFDPAGDYKALSGPETENDKWTGVMHRFRSGLDQTLERIFSAEEPFAMTGRRRRCSYCPYASLCRR